MSNFSDKVFQLINECFGAGGVTCASFAPAVTNTIYPRPGKKKSKFRKKVTEVANGILTQAQLDSLYNDDEDDPTEEYWHRPSAADYASLKQKQAEIDTKNQQNKEERLNKYKARNKGFLEKLNSIFNQWAKEPDVDHYKLNNWYADALDKIGKAERDCQYYEKMPLDQFMKLGPIKMKPVPIKFEYWKLRKILPGEE